MRVRTAGALAGLILVASVNTGTSIAEDPVAPQAQRATVTKIVVKRPARVVHRHGRLVIPPRPTVPQVHDIIQREASLWGVPVSALSNRVACESHFNWFASNGQFQGVLQFAPGTFYRGMRTIQTRRVVVNDIVIRRMHSRVYRWWSNGKLTRSDGRIVRQRVMVRRIGTIPQSPPPNHTWAQIRIGAQAIRGISAVHSSEWSCST